MGAGSRGETNPPRPPEQALERADVDRLGALVASLGVVGDPRALGERAIPVADDSGMVDEEVLPSLVGRDEAKALLVAEPLHGSGCHRYLHGCVLRSRRLLMRLQLRALHWFGVARRSSGRP